MKPSMSFAKRLALSLIGTTAILFLAAISAVGIVSYTFAYKSAIKETSALFENSLLEIEKMLTYVESSTDGNAWLSEKFSDNEAAMLDVVGNLIKSDTNIVSCAIGFDAYGVWENTMFYCPTAILEPDGNILVEVKGSEDYDYLTMDWFQIPKLLGKPYWSDPSYDNDRLIASYSRPLYRHDGSFLGVIKADIDLDWLTDMIQSVRPYDNSYTILAGRNGSYISHIDSRKIMSETVFTESLEAGDTKAVKAIQHMMSGQKGILKARRKGFKGFIVYGPLSNGWTGALVCTLKDVFSRAKRMSTISFLIAVMGLLLLYLNDRKIIERQAQPITELAYSALNISQGKFKARIPEVKSEDELRHLHDSLRYLESSIDQYITELRTTTASNERYESELNVASTIQMQMLPNNFPKFGDIDLYATLHPAKEVGGDLYDFFLEGRELYFAVGDVSGKGVPAALYMAITRSSFRFIAKMGFSPESIVSRLNDAFCDGNDSGMFVTLFAGSINIDTLEMKFCNAGHNPILIVNPDGSTRYFHAKPNLAAGLFKEFPYQGESLQLEKGTRLLIYTDGVSEAENQSKELYGEDRLEQFAQNSNPQDSSEEFINGLTASIKAFTLNNPQNDDITIMSIKL